MFWYSFLVILLCHYVISKECVTYNFEENQKVNFTNTYGICHGMCSWDVGNYSSLSIDSPHRDSRVFITPRTTLSCISSFKFSMTASGTFELNVYMEPAVKSDQITLLVFQSLPGANDATVGNVVLSPNDPNFVPGWQTMRISIVGLGTHEGYITLLGMASESSTVLVDSFRYIAPNDDKDTCVIYPDEEMTSIPDTTQKWTTTAKPSTITIPTVPNTSTTEKPSTITIPTIPVTSTTEIPTMEPGKPSTTTILTIPETSTTEKHTTITEKPSTITIPPISTTQKPSTITIPIIPTQPSTVTKPTITTKIADPVETTTRATTRPPTTTTARPRLSISVLLVKIKKYFK